ncbi:uncharacterized protein LOC124369606 [Homalodisca vitripennis]|uniref:uncharacterized protein LOC124369606 n=1 Tax=Homalodisca vitripennis TaxID=197043 RepID=UPI001EEAE10C|nr:uncharacterized protein LOC124369606 [Homalodisca vitripennis]
MVLVGDFNLNSANSPGVSSDLLYDLTNTLGLLQRSDILSARGSQLDLLFSDLPCDVHRSIDSLVNEDIHHPALDMDLSLHSLAITPQYILSPNYFKCDINQLRADVNILNSTIEHSSPDSEEKFNKYITTLSGLIKKNTPLKRIGRSPFPRWFTSDLKSKIINKKILHRIYKTTGRESDYLAFSRARTTCRVLATDCYNSYIEHVDRTISTNPKVFWSHVKNLRRTDSFPSKITLGDDESSVPDEMCNLFARHFSSVFSESTHISPALIPRDCNIYLSQIRCSPEEVKQKLDSLDISKGVGPDCIPPVVLRYCSDLICTPLSRFINSSLQEGFFPSSLKTSFVVPIYKDGRRDSATCYRPITIQSPITKMLEAIVLESLKPLISTILIPRQHGFTSGRSTVTNLVQYEEFILSAFSSFRSSRCNLPGLQ